MREASVQDTAPPRHNGGDGTVNHLFRGVFNRSLNSIGQGFLNGNFNNTFHGSYNGLFNSNYSSSSNNGFAGPAYVSRNAIPNGTSRGVPNCAPPITPIGTPNGTHYGRANGMPDINGSYTPEPTTRPSEPCLFPGCTGHTFTAAPFCAQHLSQISSKQDAAAASAEATQATSTSTHTAKSNGTAASPSTSAGPGQQRNSVLSSEPSVTYLRRKTAPNSGPRPPTLSRTSSSISSSTPHIGGPSIISNGTPAAPSPRTGNESTSGSYFAASHTRSGHTRVEAQQNGEHGQKRDSFANGASSILTPSESPPDLSNAHNSRKRPRTESHDYARQANGAHTAHADFAPSASHLPSSRPSESSNLSSLFTAQSGIAQESQPDVPMPDIVDSQTRTDSSSSQASKQGLPSQTTSKQDDTARARLAGGSVNDSAAGAATSSRLGLRQSLLQRIEERNRERNKNPIGNGSDASTKVAMPYSLDTYIYNQGPEVAPLTPPPGVVVVTNDSLEAEHGTVAAMLPSARPSTASSSSLSAKPDYVYAHIDPRVHWTRARPKDWHEAKQKEITARGGRKANFGKAAKRAATARRRSAAERQVESQVATNGTADSVDTNVTSSSGRNLRQPKVPKTPAVVALPPRQLPSAWSGELPPDVAHNKNWVSMLSLFAQDEDARQPEQATKSRRNKGR